MTSNLETQAARLFSVGFHGKAPSDDLIGLLERGVGGVIFFARNVGQPEELAELTNSIKRRAGRPIAISLDQEGGKVARLRQGFSELPSMRALGETHSASLSREIGALIGRELRAVGFDLNYAPVLDVDTNPDNPVIGSRSFGRTPDLVAELGVALAQGLESAGVAACGKHFPGHGDTMTDSHHELPRIDHDWERLERVELLPFRRAAEAELPMIMTAHVVFAALDAARPATLSPAVMTGLLRERLGYRGLILSDDLDMRAIAGHMGADVAAVAAVRAGCDVLLLCRDEDNQALAEAALIREAERDSALRQQIGEAARRIRALKHAHAARVAALPPIARDVVGSAAHRALSERLAGR